MDKLSQVQRHRIHFFLEENIKEVYKKCTKELKLLVLYQMYKDVDESSGDNYSIEECNERKEDGRKEAINYTC